MILLENVKYAEVWDLNNGYQIEQFHVDSINKVLEILHLNNPYIFKFDVLHFATFHGRIFRLKPTTTTKRRLPDTSSRISVPQMEKFLKLSNFRFIEISSDYIEIGLKHGVN